MKITRFLLAVGFVLALAFAFVGCSGSDDGSSDQEQSSSSSSAMDVSSSSSVEVVNSSSSVEAESSSSSVEVSSSSSVILSSSSYVCDQEGIIDGSPVSYGGETYETVVICNQTWLNRNLNYVPPDGNSWCYSGTENSTGSDVNITSEEGCAKYSRLYDWATAMALPISCNSSSCSGQVQAKHQGICPPGWHIPTDDDWSTLENNVGGSSTAGRKLKAQNGWYDCGPSGSGNLCEDTYGFSALPGGYRLANGDLRYAGREGDWWSVSEVNASLAYRRNMYYYGNSAYRDYNSKSLGYSVRCVKD
jgi:uncharacterized protein (TIGR02145 family)